MGHDLAWRGWVVRMLMERMDDKSARGVIAIYLHDRLALRARLAALAERWRATGKRNAAASWYARADELTAALEGET